MERQNCSVNIVSSVLPVLRVIIVKSVVLVSFPVNALFRCWFCSGMSAGMPVAPTMGIGTNIGMSTVPGMGMDPTAAAGLGVTPGLGMSTPDVTTTMAPGSVAATVAPPIATECLLVSNLFDASKSALLSLLPVYIHFFCISTLYFNHCCQMVLEFVFLTLQFTFDGNLDKVFCMGITAFICRVGEKRCHCIFVHSVVAHLAKC